MCVHVHCTHTVDTSLTRLIELVPHSQYIEYVPRTPCATVDENKSKATAKKIAFNFEIAKKK